MSSSEDFQRQLRMAFRTEAQEHVQSLTNNLVILETTSGDEQRKLVEQCFRSMHNIKGSAHAVEFVAVESLCHPMEDIMAAVKSGNMQITPDVLDLLLEGVALVARLLVQEDSSNCEQEVADTQAKLYEFTQTKIKQDDGDESEMASPVAETAAMSEPVEAAAPPPYVPPPSAPPSTPPPPPAKAPPVPGAPALAPPVAPQKQTGAAVKTPSDKQEAPVATQEVLKISTEKLDHFMQSAEEMLALKGMARQSSIRTSELLGRIEFYSKGWSKSTPEINQARMLLDRLHAAATNPHEELLLRKITNVLNAHGELLNSVETEIRELSRFNLEHWQSAATYVDLFLDETKSLLMMPCSTLFEGFPLMVRQLSRQLGKEVDITVSGGDIEMDKRILGYLKDPLVHIIRNSIDHGIEAPKDRTAAGKPVRGTISLSVVQVDRIVEIRITDDGRGIDSAKVKATAMKQGIISEEEAKTMSDRDAWRLIFKSSLSTSSIITEISGRGIGLAIVEEKLQQIGGNVDVESQPGAGTTFIFRVPLTIATFRGVLVEAGGKIFVVPTSSTDRVVRIETDSIKPVEGADTVLLDGHVMPVCALENVLQLPISSKARHDDGLMTVVVLRSGSEKVGFVVDEVLGEQEVLVKNLGPVFSGIGSVTGVTVLGSGDVAPIINVNDLIEAQRSRKIRAVPRSGMSRKEQAELHGGGFQEKDTPGSGKGIKVLVVDDMVTARMLMRNIFETAGFQVKTANDGIEALTFLRADQFDAVVTDIEMPRMNGIELCKAIRADAGLNHLPVVLVTNMTSREDRERGVTAGANAYFVKSSFDSANLLQVVASLVV